MYHVGLLVKLANPTFLKNEIWVFNRCQEFYLLVNTKIPFFEKSGIPQFYPRANNEPSAAPVSSCKIALILLYTIVYDVIKKDRLT